MSGVFVQNSSQFLKRPAGTYVIEQTVWFVVKSQYRFQTDSMYNQMEDVVVHLLNLCIRETEHSCQIAGPETLYLVLTEYHGRLFANYYKWCDYLDEEPFPWRKPPWLAESYCAPDATDTPLTSITVIGGSDTSGGELDKEHRPQSFRPQVDGSFQFHIPHGAGRYI